ncbi:DUF4386 domain-containing protein [Spirosoma luteum]|uniref:DUF4386 domain-containing protein n=1 Tax=Spirosoma luteum TaxID=431553 RepID=UPI00036F92E7|nr:DUF4386 domain-containing protein [Spirosoma luteum]
MRRAKELSFEEGKTSITLYNRRTDKSNAIVTGCFFIVATVSAIIGLLLYDPLLTSTDYLHQGAANYSQIILGAVFEMVLVIAACGTAIMLYPYLKRYNEQMALGYFCFRVLETVFILLGLVSVLSLLTLSYSYTTASNADTSIYDAVGTIAKAFHDWTFILGSKFMLGINTFIYSYVFYKTGLVPNKLSLLGITGASLVFIASLLAMFGIIDSFSTGELLLVFPIAIYEMVLAFWLIAKGFNIHYTIEAFEIEPKF